MLIFGDTWFLKPIQKRQRSNIQNLFLQQNKKDLLVAVTSPTAIAFWVNNTEIT